MDDVHISNIYYIFHTIKRKNKSNIYNNPIMVGNIIGIFDNSDIHTKVSFKMRFMKVDSMQFLIDSPQNSMKL